MVLPAKHKVKRESSRAAVGLTTGGSLGSGVTQRGGGGGGAANTHTHT